MKFNIVKNRKIWFTFSGTLTILSLFTIASCLFGWFGMSLNLSLDFTGGMLIKYSFTETVNNTTTEKVQGVVNSTLTEFNKNKSEKEKINIGNPVIRTSGDNDINVKIRIPQNVDAKQQESYMQYTQQLSKDIASKLNGNQVSSRAISPSIGDVLKQQALWAVAISIILIVLYIVLVFRNIPKIYNPWVFGMNTIIALCHDVIILIGIFAALGFFLNIEIGPFFITALLTLLGYSVNDTIVVFDRVRENMSIDRGSSVEDITEKSVWQTMARSINTSMTVIITLVALLFFGAEAIQSFVLALLIGVIFGTYSSIFIGSTLLVTFKKYLLKKKA